MPKDTYGNELLIGPESSFFKDRNEWTGPPKGHFSGNITTRNDYGSSTDTDNGNGNGGSRRRRRVRPSRKYKKSAKRVFRKKSRSTRRR